MTDKIKNKAVISLFAILLCAVFVFQLVTPSKELSKSERRPLQQMPEINATDIVSGKFMSKFEDFSMDQFPMRDTLRSTKAVFSNYVLLQKDNNGLYLSNDYISKIEYPMSKKSLDNASARFKNIYDKYLDGKAKGVYLSVIPDKNFFLADESGRLSIDYDEFISYLADKNSYMNFIDISDCLDISDYYRTDTHWRQEKIVDVATLIAENMGVSIDTDFEQKKIDDTFYGVYHGQLALPVSGEELYYLDNAVISSSTVYDSETNKSIPVYNMELAKGSDLYEMFLSGSKALLTITNPNAKNDRSLVIFRDSFGSSIAPLLIDGYSSITLVDIRYISPEILGDFVDFENADVLFLYSTLVLNNSITFK